MQLMDELPANHFPARVIEEELLKDLANKSELSDWFSREDVPVQQFPLPERPNPKNAQNVEKIAELEEQIQRLAQRMSSLRRRLTSSQASNGKGGIGISASTA